MSKYTPLENYLKSVNFEKIPMTFDEIEAIIGDSLPPSARQHRPWWSNNPSNSRMTQSWLAAGFKAAKVKLDTESLVFIKFTPQNGPTRVSWPQTLDDSVVHPAFGCLRGSAVIADDTDLTAPTMSEWSAAASDARLCNE